MKNTIKYAFLVLFAQFSFASTLCDSNEHKLKLGETKMYCSFDNVDSDCLTITYLGNERCLIKWVKLPEDISNLEIIWDEPGISSFETTWARPDSLYESGSSFYEPIRKQEINENTEEKSNENSNSANQLTETEHPQQEREESPTGGPFPLVPTDESLF